MRLSRLSLILFLLCSFSLFFYQLNSTYLTNWDEAWHAVIARNMAQSGNFVTPEYNGKHWFATAPLYLWLVGLWFQLTDYSVLGVRLFSALAGWGSVVLIYLIGSRLKHKYVGFIAGLVLTTTIHFLFRSRQGNLDAPLAFFNCLAVWFYLKGLEDKQWFSLIGVATALAFLTKNILGLFPLIFLFFMPLASAMQVLALFFLIAAPWHLLAYQLHGYGFINHYFLQYVLSKATHANPVSGTEVFWYVGVLKHGLKIWFLALPFAVIWNFAKLGHLSYASKTQSLNKIFSSTRPYLIALVWSVLPFVLLSLARMRNDWYIISIYPGIALLIGLSAWECKEILQKQLSKARLNLPTNAIEAVFITLLFTAGLINLVKYKESYIVPETVRAEVALATQARAQTDPNQRLILDDNYLPVALFYSERLVYPVRYSRQAESLVGDDGLREATSSGNRYVLTNTQTMDLLLEKLHQPEYQILLEEDDKLLIKLEYPQ